MSIPITVASTKALTTRESPGIVTLITSDEIAASGARDLIDVLRQVPGFEFGVDVQGTVGLRWGIIFRSSKLTALRSFADQVRRCTEGMQNWG